MIFTIVCFCLLGYCFILTKYAYFSIETTPFFVLSSVIFLLYIFAYIHLLTLGAYIILGVGGLSFLYSFIIFYKERSVLFDKYFTASFVLWLILCLIVLLFATQKYIISWDEFGFWGKYAKFIVHNRGLITFNNFIEHKSYPPGSSLLYYLFFPMGDFRESTMMAARQLLVLCPFVVMLRSRSFKDWRFIVIYIIGAFIFLYYTLHFIKAPVDAWNKLYVDIPIAFFLGAILVQYRWSDRKLYDLLKLIPPIAILPLLKVKLGAALALILIFIITDQLFRRLWALKTAKRKLLYYPSILKQGLGILLLLVIPLLVAQSWESYYVHQLHAIAERQLPHLTLPMIWHIITMQQLSPFQLQVVRHFYDVIHRPFIFSTLFFMFGLLIAFLNNGKQERYFIVIANIILWVGSFIYLFGLLFSYLYTFTPWEARVLMESGRYISIYYVAWFLFLYNCLFFPFLYRKLSHRSKAQWIILIILGVFALGVIFSYYFRNKCFTQGLVQLRQSVMTMTNTVKKSIPIHAKVQIVWQADDAFPAVIIGYALSPRPYATTKLITKDKSNMETAWTVDQWLQSLATYQYVLLGYTNATFWQYYKKAFIEKPTMLKPYAKYLLCTSEHKIFGDQKKCIPHKVNAYLFKVVHGPAGVKLEAVNR